MTTIINGNIWRYLFQYDTIYITDNINGIFYIDTNENYEDKNRVRLLIRDSTVKKMLENKK